MSQKKRPIWRMMLLNSCSDCESEQLCGTGAEAGRPVENPEPSGVVGEVFRGNTLEADHPCAQARTKSLKLFQLLTTLKMKRGLMRRYDSCIDLPARQGCHHLNWRRTKMLPPPPECEAWTLAGAGKGLPRE